MLPPKLLFACLSLLQTVSAIWPLPLHYSNGSKVLWLSPDFQTVYKPLSSVQTWENLHRYLLCVAYAHIEPSALLILYTGHGGILFLPLYMIFLL